jgi:flavin-dependent dehydrogenase
MCEGDTTPYFEKLVSRLNDWMIPPALDVKPRQRMLPLTPIPRTYGNRFLVAGDAAGFVKPVTGGGVYYGMISADLAAVVLAQALRRDRLGESELSEYQKLWQGRLMEEIEAQLTLRLLLQRLTDGEVETIFDLWATDSLMPLIRKTASFNQYRKLIAAVVRNPGMRKILFSKMLT